MRRLTLTGVETLNEEDSKRIFDEVYKDHNKNYHYLAFDRQLTGFSPLGTFVKDNELIVKNESKIMELLLDNRQVMSLYPLENLTLYPIIKINDVEYEIEFYNADKHFRDIASINDELYKTPYLFVDFGHGANNFNEELILNKLRELLSNCKILKEIYLEC